VALVIGNRTAIPHSLLAPGATLGSSIVNQFAEATPGLGTSSVIALGGVLLLLTVLVNLVGQAMLRRRDRVATNRDAKTLAPGPPVTVHDEHVVTPAEVGAPDTIADETTRRLQAVVRERSAGSFARRRTTSLAMQALCGLAVLIGVAPLVALAYYTIDRGVGAISWSFLTHAPTPQGVPGGGISTAITGSAKIAGLALLMAVPIGLLTALFLFERKGRLAASIRFAAAVLTGVPSIIIGIFAYGLFVRTMHHPSDVAAGFALAVLMLPIMIRANEEAMRTVPVDLWEAGMALGARRSRVARTVVLRQALPGLFSGNILGLARGVGETAPLLFTVAAPTLAITLLIYDQGQQAFASAQQTAWGAALVLLVVVLLLSLVTRTTAWMFARRAG
jgi:phosphate transport system permease protein